MTGEGLQPVTGDGGAQQITNEGDVDQQVIIGKVGELHIHGDGRKVPFLAPPWDRELIGRDALVAELKKTLFAGGSKDIVALTHLPGVGKTSIALELAYDETVINHFDDGVLWAGLGRTPDLMVVLGRWARAVGVKPDELVELQTVEERRSEVQERIDTKRMLVVIDDAWDIRDAAVFRLGGPDCAHMITTRSPQVAFDFSRQETTVVPELDDDDALALLSEIAPRAVAAHPDAARALVESVGGLPLAVTLIGLYLGRESLSGQPEDLLDALERLRDARHRLEAEAVTHDLPVSLLASIQLSDDALDEDGKVTLRRLSVFRAKPKTFTRDAAVSITGADPAALRALAAAGLLESSSAGYALQRTVSEYARLRLGEGEAQELHRRAADYYAALSADYRKDDDISEYARWYRYEEAPWQELNSAWLFHLSQLDDRDAHRVAFARAYLDAFWWWGMFLEFPYCRRLLEDWNQTVRDATDSDWLAALRALHRSYPREGVRGSWEQAEAAVRSFRTLARLDGDELDDDRRAMRGITSVLLGEAFSARGSADADACYDDAIRSFEACDDPWSAAWTRYYLAEALLARGELDSAVAACDAADDDGDRELLSNVAAVRGDIAWERGDRDTAIARYVDALRHAFAFQAIPHPPDPYTQLVYHSTVERVVEQLQSLDSPELQARCLELHGAWKAYWELRGDEPAPPPEPALAAEHRAALVAYLCPAEPSADDLKQGAAYARLVRDVLAHMEEQTARV